MSITAGNYTLLNTVNTTQHELTINSSSNNSLSVLGGTTIATLKGLHFNTPSGGVLLSDGATFHLDGSHPLGAKLTVGKTLFGDGNLKITNSALANISQEMIVGHAVTGSLTIESGGKLTSNKGTIANLPGTTGTATVTGAGSSWNIGENQDLVVGNLGTRIVNVEAGAQLTSGRALIGTEVGSSGTVNVSGVGSQWSDQETTVGNKGNGTLNILDGGEVSSGGALIGSGTLNITAGGIVTSKVAILGQKLDSPEFAEFRGVGTANVTGAGSKWTTSERLTVGEIGKGAINIQSSGEVEVTTDSFLGQSSTGDGTVTVTGLNSKWSSLAGLHVGNAGKGKLDILAGGAVTSAEGQIGEAATGTGNVTVGGQGSKWTNENNLTIAGAGTGTLQVEATGSVTSKNASIGAQANSIGTATVTGQESRWTNSEQLLVGQFGSGTLNVNAGGRVAIAKSVLGLEFGSTGKATVSGPGSTWSNSSSLTVGDLGAATLDIENAGEVTSVSGSVGLFNRSTGAVTVTGEGSRWRDTENLQIGFEGNGKLTVAAKGRVENRAGIVGANVGGVGAVTVTGENSTWTNSDFLIVAQSGSGKLNVEAGAFVSNRNGFVGLEPNSQGVVTVTGSGSHQSTCWDGPTAVCHPAKRLLVTRDKSYCIRPTLTSRQVGAPVIAHERRRFSMGDYI